ncbi:MAG: PTS fructose-like transporter subunit IIB [Cardiobacteriaceae bacterium]|nr:PTS fructose-like transporter subunit IIB [Cardiobacteriaceae bacterium]
MNRLYVPRSIGWTQGLLVQRTLEKFSGEHWHAQSASEAKAEDVKAARHVVVLAGEDIAPCLSAFPHHDIAKLLDNPQSALPLPAQQQNLAERPLKLVAVTSCPSGVAHTFMAADALDKAAQAKGYAIMVETQGSVGSQNTLTTQAIEEADLVVIAADTEVPLDRFLGKRIYCAGTKVAINNPTGLLQKAIADAQPYHGQGAKSALHTEVKQAKAKMVAVTSCPSGIAHTFMAAEGLQQAAEKLGIALKIETQGSIGAQNVLTDAEIAAADVVLIAADTRIDISRFVGKRLYHSGTKVAIHQGESLLQKALTEASIHHLGTSLNQSALSAEAPKAKQDSREAPSALLSERKEGQQRIVAITSCPTGVAHTFMAAEGLQLAAEQLGHVIKVETQGSVGAQNVLTEEEIAVADVVIIAADTHVDVSRFVGKRLYRANTKRAIGNGSQLVQSALLEAKVHQGEGSTVGANEAQSNSSAMGIYKHLMTGVSHMLPFVVAGGLLIALGFALGTYQFGDQGIHVYQDQYKGSLSANVFWLGKAAFALFVPILAGFIAFSIAGRAALAPAMIGGYLSDQMGAGFLGAIVAGYVVGYLIQWLNRIIQLPRSLDALKPMLLLPLIGTSVIGLSMYYVVAPPVADLLESLKSALQSMQSSSDGIVSAAILGAVLGGMMAVDMGGPINKAAYMVGTALLGTEIYTPMAAVMAGGMTPPLAIFFATWFFKNRFTAEEREAGKATGVLGLSFITEGAIPFAAKDPFRVIPALIAGSALAGAMSMAAGVALHAPHGGVFVLFIPNAIQGLGSYVVALAAGTALSTILLGVLKPALRAA